MRRQYLMPDPIVSTVDPVTLAGGSQIATIDLNISLTVAPVFVAVDGGANAALAAGLSPVAVIGDLDSISDAARAAFGSVLHHIPEQDTTDFEKAVTRIDAPLIVAVGFTGARLDHMLAVLNVLARFPQRRIILLGGGDATCLLPPMARLQVPPRTRVSLMPLGPARVSTKGLRWDLDGADFAPDGFHSASNEAASARVTIASEGPVLLIVPDRHLPALLTGL